MSTYPWLKFYPQDWRGDPALRMCSLACRGLWIEMLGIMHEATPRGFLLVNGTPPTEIQLALLVGAFPEQLTELLGELEAAKVFSRNRKGDIYSRRMLRDEKKSQTAKKNGKTGGNPTLSKQTTISPSDNLGDKPPDKLRSQIPELEDKSNTDVLPKPSTKPKRKIDDVFKTDWSLPDDFRSFAVSKGLEDPNGEWEDFFDFWKSEGVGKADWLATWRNRVRKAVKRRGIGGTDSVGSNRPAPNATSQGARIALDRRRAKDAEIRQSNMPPTYG